MSDTVVTTWFAGIVLTAMIAGLGCGDQILFECNYDSDCAGDEYCIEQQCRAGCSGDEECGANTYCSAYQRESQSDPVQVCMAPEVTDTGCETDRECRQQFDGQQARCGIHGRCVLTSSNGDDGSSDNATTNDAQNGDSGATNAGNEDVEADPWILVVEQLGADGEPVADDSNDDSSGADAELLPVRVGAVVVRDGQESLIGHGRVVAVTRPDGDESVEGRLSYPLAEDGMCIEQPREAAHTSLGGPGGRAYIELVRDDSDPDIPQEAQYVQIVAGGPECPIGQTATDEEPNFGQYRALLCNAPAPQPDLEDCEHRFAGPHSGYTSLDVAFSN